MSLTSAQLIALANEISALNTLVPQIQAICTQLKSAGITLYNDANLLSQFPNDGPGARTWMSNTNTQLTSFMATLTNMPSLNG